MRPLSGAGSERKDARPFDRPPDHLQQLPRSVVGLAIQRP